jgi:hypothetical protein
LILSCATCNGDEKRDLGWREFIERKVADESLRDVRVRRIESWMALHPPLVWTPSPDVEALVADLDAMADDFGTKCAQLRLLVAEERNAAQSASTAQGSPRPAP